ncbi:MAG: winged helix-turn-helix transcriptional regulator [Candidatus Methanofastidiosia archaeon]|jgi:DNA-binding HxlR family transcriptional regulator
MTKNEKIIKLLGFTGAIFILEYMDTHTKTQYKELNKTLAAYTLNCRLQELLESNLIEHHFERKEKRREWYTITKKGKKVLHIIHKLQELPE